MYTGRENKTGSKIDDFFLAFKISYSMLSVAHYSMRKNSSEQASI